MLWFESFYHGDTESTKFHGVYSVLLYVLRDSVVLFLLTLEKLLTMYAYDTVTAAVNGLKQRGYTKDFNLEENSIVCHEDKYYPEDFEIVEVYRYEGNSDPADEAVVYAIEGKGGEIGGLVSGYGISADEMSDEMAKKLNISYKE